MVAVPAGAHVVAAAAGWAIASVNARRARTAARGRPNFIGDPFESIDAAIHVTTTEITTMSPQAKKLLRRSGSAVEELRA
jgi:hypothetical protein